MSKPRLSFATKEAIVRDYRAGTPLKVIGDKYGVHQSYPGLLSKRFDQRKTLQRYEPKQKRDG